MSPTGGAEDDWALVRSCLDDGRLEAFDRLIAKYQDRVHALIARLTSERDLAADLTQETFVKAFRGLDRFKGDSAFYTWLYRIAVNVARTELRKSKGRIRPLSLSMSRDRGGERNPGLEVPDPGHEPPRILLDAEDREMVERAIASLVPDFREIVILRDVEERSYEEIADILDVPIGTVRSRLHRARLELKALLADLLR